MKTLGAFALALFFAAGAFAQHRGLTNLDFGSPVRYGANGSFVRPNTYGNFSGFGNVVYPGTGHPPTEPNPFSITDTTFASRLGTTVGGFGGRGFNRFRGQAVVPYAYPVFIGGYGDYGGYQQDPNVTVIAPQQAPPQVIINQNFISDRAAPVLREYSQDSSSGVHIYEAPSRQPVETTAEDNTAYYLLAFKDHSIYSAFAYWVEGETLHYVTPLRVHNQASLSLVDRELTDKLNRGRMPVKLPQQ